MEKPRILAVVGPTAGGKSALAEALALRLDGEIVSCDSMQIYRHMDIGTAKPTKAEQERVPYHLIDIVEPEQEFSAADYATAAEEAVREIHSRGKLPIFCGGTGLYLDVFLRGMPEAPASDATLRAQLMELAERQGALFLHEELKKVDAESAKSIHPSNVRRVARALEIYRATGVTKTEWDRRSRLIPPRYSATVLGVTYQNRELLYARADARVEQMLSEGLLEETKYLLKRGVFRVSKTAASAIGYKELLPYFAGECALETAVEELKKATRRYAKRQITWFSAKDYVCPLWADDGEKMLKYEEFVNNALKIVGNA